MTSETESERGSNSRICQEGNFEIIATSKTGLQFTLKRSNHNSTELSKMKDNNEEADSDSEIIEESASSKNENSDDDSSTTKIPVCPECSKIFPSLKSLYGHLRSHPNKGYRGAIRPRTNFKRAHAHGHAQPNPKATSAKRVIPIASNWGTKAKRGQTELDAINDAAEILMSMCTGNRTRVLEPTKTHQCSTCNKSFATHQALGGHRASHNKVRSISESETLIEHKCKTCNETFATGQALGGHMRRHFTGLPSTVRDNRAISFNLNEAPQVDEVGEL